MISLVQVEYLLALYEERNFQRAAERCFVTQPTLSVQIKKAERQLGGRLFNRDITPLEPTPLFMKILPVLHQLNNDMRTLKQKVLQDTDGVKEELRIGVIPTIAHYLIPDMFGILNEQLKDFSLKFEEYRTAELLELLEKRKLDIIILSGPLETKGFEIQKLFIEEIAFYMKEPKKLDSVRGLIDEDPWLLTEGNCLRAQMINFCELKTNETAKWDYQGSSIDVLIRMVDRYGGYTLIPMNYPKDHINNGNIVRMRESVPARSVIAGYHRKNSNYDALVKIIQAIQTVYTNDASKDWEFIDWH